MCAHLIKKTIPVFILNRQNRIDKAPKVDKNRK